METCKISGYFGVLSREQVIKFFALFYEIEVCTGTEVSIHCVNIDKYNVILIAIGDMDAPLLVASFTDGKLHREKWDKVFFRV